MKTSVEKERSGMFKKLSRKVGKTIHDHNLLSPEDRLLVGLSGGKDSLVLLELLSDRKRALPFPFSIFAVYVHVTDSGASADEEFLTKYCESLDIPLYIEKIEAGISGSQKKSPCFLCSWHRRKKIFELTKKLQCNKLSFGHHRDDVIETFMINMIYHGSISALPYTLRMFEGRVHLIRPLLDIWEKEIEDYAILRNYKSMNSLCPYDDKTKRQYVRNIIEEIEVGYPKSKINMFHALGNQYPDYLPSFRKISKKR